MELMAGFIQGFSADEIGLALALAFTLVGAMTSALGSIFSVQKARRAEAVAEKTLAELVSDSDEIDLDNYNFESVARVDELRQLSEKYRTQSRRNAFSHNSLVFGQYIIGAMLASSFIQENFQAGFVGVLGVLVLLSSAIQQRYRPDVLAMQAKVRMFKCNRLIRIAEDGIILIKAKSKKSASILDIRKQMSSGIDVLEQDELAGTEAYYELRAGGEGG